MQQLTLIPLFVTLFVVDSSKAVDYQLPVLPKDASFQSHIVLEELKINANASTDKPFVYTNEGDDAEIFCYVKVPELSKNFCRFIKIGNYGDYEIVINVTNDKTEIQLGTGNYSYFGAGANSGECGLRILSVSHNQFGRWACNLIPEQGAPSHVYIDLLEYEAPQRPVINIPDGTTSINVTDFRNGTEGESMTINCCTIGGKPIHETKLGLFIGTKELPGVVLKKSNETDSSDSVTCIQKTKTIFLADDNGKKLICKGSHPAFKDYSIDSEPVEINVNHPPEILYPTPTKDGDFIIYRNYSKENGTVDLFFNVAGNPLPTVTAKLEATNETLNDTQAQHVFSKDNVHQFVVTLNIPTENSVPYNIFIENYLGSDFAPTIVTPPDNNQSTTWILLAIGITMLLIFLGIILCFLNAAAKAKGWFGYTPRSGVYPVKRNATRGANSSEYTSVSGAGSGSFQ